MLRLLIQGHKMADPVPGEQMLSCCGFSIYPDETMEYVFISGCCHGADCEARHRAEAVMITAEAGYWHMDGRITAGKYQNLPVRWRSFKQMYAKRAARR